MTFSALSIVIYVYICLMNWHICTDGLAGKILFKSREEYIFGMNGIPVCALPNGVTITAFCLMSNHVHFIVSGEDAQCRKFIRSYKKRLSEISDTGQAYVCMKPVEDPEYLMRAICYVLRNPVGAGIRIMPQTYPWSSAALYFKGKDCHDSIYRSICSKAGNISVREMREILHSHISIPSDYTILQERIIDPQCYTDTATVERLFRTPARMLYLLAKNENMEMELEAGLMRKTRFTDNELTASVAEICRNTFGKDSAETLCMEDRYRLAALLRKRYGITCKQAARLTWTDPELLKKIM